MAIYKAANSDIWQGRHDSAEGSSAMRWHERMEFIDLRSEETDIPGPVKKGIALLGFCCDEGVRLNHGRTGAAQGPDSIRSACANLPDHLAQGSLLIDAGNLFPGTDKVEVIQAQLGYYQAQLLDMGLTPLVLGGGHELAFGSFLGLAGHNSGASKIGIINLDAHFDLRIPSPQANSGTSFYQMYSWCQERSVPFEYLCVGIQEFSNTRALFQRAEHLGAEYISADELRKGEALDAGRRIDRFVENADVVYLSICLDVFNASQAPGVSAPNPAGIDVRDALPIVRRIARSGKLACADIAELNPAYDIDRRTARLASCLLFEISRLL